MRKLLLAGAAMCALGLAGCNTTGALGTVAAAQPDITNNLSLACQSAEGLLDLAATKGSGKFASTAASLDADVVKYCGKAIAAGPALATALNVINTTAAVLLGLGVAL